VEGLGALGKRVSGAIRQPSGGPTFNIKGSAAGGGKAQCIPMSEFSLGLTGDIDAITNAHNLGMVALTSRMQHEFNYGDETLAKKNLRRLDIDPYNPAVGWAMDFSAQALRHIIIGLGGKMDGFPMQSSFQISVSSELMAILAVATDLADMRARIAKMTLGFDRGGAPVSAADLEVDGAMAAIMVKTINPTLMQTLEGQPVLVHAGPFANIAIGQSSIIADRLGLATSEYHVTESGFGADIGFEKFWNLKTRFSGLTPDAAVIVATIRALKMHGGAPRVVPGRELDEVYSRENPKLVEAGCDNLVAHIETVKKSGITPVVAINDFPTDTDAERTGYGTARKPREKSSGSRRTPKCQGTACAWQRPSSASPTTPRSRAVPQAGRCRLRTCRSTTVRSSSSPLPATSSSCRAPPRTPPTAASTWTPRPVG
jgi:formate--tetrahydrofolate ligase